MVSDGTSVLIELPSGTVPSSPPPSLISSPSLATLSLFASTIITITSAAMMTSSTAMMAVRIPTTVVGVLVSSVLAPAPVSPVLPGPQFDGCGGRGEEDTVGDGMSVDGGVGDGMSVDVGDGERVEVDVGDGGAGDGGGGAVTS